MKNNHLKLTFILLTTSLLFACNGGGQATASSPNTTDYFESVINFKIGNGVFTGTLKNKQPYTGEATNITFLDGLFSGKLESGIIIDGQGTNIVFQENDRTGKFSGSLLKNAPITGTAENLCTRVKKQDLEKECFTGILYNSLYYQGKLLYNGTWYKFEKGGPSNDYALYQSSKKTPFQNYLSAYESSPNSLALHKVVFGESGYNKVLSISDKVDINNDNIRRFFETALAKDMLVQLLKNPISYKQLREFTNNFINFERFALTSDGLYPSAKRSKEEITDLNISKKWYADWLRATSGTYSGPDFAFEQLNLVIPRYTEQLKDPKLGLTPAQQQLLLDLYKVHYLAYKVQFGPLYKAHEKRYGEFMNEIYKTHPLYVKRGRIEIHGIYNMVNSRNLGILRWNDVGIPNSEYMDMKKPIYQFEDPRREKLDSRGPDRYNIELLDQGTNVDNDSWLVENFDNGVSPVVNGLSGSILVETKDLLFMKYILKHAGSVNAQELSRFKINKDFLQDPNTIINYYRALTGHFIYLDGGHSLFETLRPLKIDIVQDEINSYFGDMLKNKILPENLIFGDNTPVVESAVAETLNFVHNFEQHKQEMINLKANEPFLSWNP